MTPVFIFSTPRAGSTLLQRMLACHQKVATSPEPWILLPLLSMSDDIDNNANDNGSNDDAEKYSSSTQNTTLANYSFATSTTAINNFAYNINRKSTTNNSLNYNELLKNFVMSLYLASAENDEEFFVDKTPRYYYIIDQIITIFPKAKFIFLFRNPLQTYASVLTTWNNNNFYKLYRNLDDLYLAPKLLSAAYELHQDKSIAINYDNLVRHPDETLKKIFDYLNIEALTSEELNLSKQKFASNQMGDKTGQKKYKAVSTNSIKNWHKILNNPIRKWYLKRYINHLGTNVENIYGYSASELKHQLKQLPTKIDNTLVHDILGIVYHNLVYKFKLNLLFSNKLLSNKSLSNEPNKDKSGFYD